MNYYQHHIGDFNNATRHLTRLEKSVYRDLIELYYETESPLTADLDALARRVIARQPEERAALEDILDEFFTLEDGEYHHSRCDEELAKVYAKSEKARESAAKRWDKKKKRKASAKPPESERNAPAIRTHSEGNATQDPIPNITTTTTRPTVQDVAEYVETRDIKINPAQFVDYYTANGWKVGRNPMKDWRAAVRQWERNERKPAGDTTRGRSLADDLSDTSWAQQ